MPCGGDDFEIDSLGSVRIEGIKLPGRSLSNADLGLANTGRFLARRYRVSNEPGNLQFLRSLQRDISTLTRIEFEYCHANLNVKSGVKSHRQIALIIFIEHAKETLLEDGRRK